ncbi:hypothetical protein SAMN05428970_2000 [Agromyces sp. CF514]|nr:hypothetical protein SAMN05428970_2000 [Agromyces sp. CF514]
MTVTQTRKLIDCTCPQHGGKKSHVFEDAPLLVQLEEAIRSSIGGSMSGAGLASTRNLLDPAALYQSMLITDAIGSWCRLAGVKPTRDASADLVAWHAASPDAGEFYTAQLVGWAEFIRAKMDPTKALEVSGACPECGATVWADLDGVEHPRPVLLTYHPEDPLTTVAASCRSAECFAEWQGEMAVRLLRAQIDSDPAALLAFLRNSG